MQYICEITPKEFNEEDQTPTFLRATVVDPNSVQLTWRVASVTCELLGYIISYEEDDATVLVNVTGGQASEVLLKNLQSNTVYVFFVSAVTTSGNVLTDGRSVRVSTPAVGVCGETTFTSASGTVMSPNYPGLYPNNQDCVYTIMLPDITSVIRVEFNAFELEEGQDFLYVGVGPTPDEALQFSLTGTELPGVVVGESSMMWMRFSSDESMAYSGFMLTYTSLEKEPSGESEGSITVLFVDMTAGQFDEEMQLAFATSIADQLNVFCREAADNCLTGSNVEFTATNVIYTSIITAANGLEVTFWVNDPSDPTGRRAGVSANKLEQMVKENEENLEKGQFDLIVQKGVGNEGYLTDPWLIAITAILIAILLLVLLVAVRQCFKSNKDKDGFYSPDRKSDDVEMSTGVNNNGADLDDEVSMLTSQPSGLPISVPPMSKTRTDSLHNTNVYYEYPVDIADVGTTEMMDFSAQTDSRVDPQEDAESLYAKPERKSTRKQREEETSKKDDKANEYCEVTEEDKVNEDVEANEDDKVNEVDKSNEGAEAKEEDKTVEL